MHNTAQAEPRLYTYIAEWALQPSVSGSLVLSVQCESRVKYLGITTCCPTLWLRDNATLKLYRFRWRMRTLKNRKYRTATLISAYKLEKLLKKIQVVLFTKSALVCFITDHLGERERIIITFLSSKRCIITLPSTSQLGTRCRLPRGLLLSSAPPCSSGRQRQAALIKHIIPATWWQAQETNRILLFNTPEWSYITCRYLTETEGAHSFPELSRSCAQWKTYSFYLS